MASDDLYARWNAGLAGLIRSVDNFNAGAGPMGEALTSAQVYEALNGSLRETRDSVREFRVDPRKFLRVKVF
jgi:phospholipid/cholesterol/gamma-HCH transport system substrate-binding protein